MPHPIDVHVGRRIRYRRWMVGQTQQQLAEAVGIKFQQIQKYETGMNRVSASRLYDISRALEIPVAFFFEDLDESTGGVKLRDAAGDGSHIAIEQFSDKEALDFLRFYYLLDDEPRRRIYELTRSIVKPAA